MNTKKITTLLFSVIVAIIFLGQSQAFAHTTIYEGETKTSEVIYFDSAEQYNKYTSLYIYGIEENAKISNVKSSNQNVVEVENYYYDDVEGSPYIFVSLTCKEAGNATITLTVNDTKYTDTIKVVAYKNPISSLTISGISKGQNLKSDFDENYYTNLVWAGNFTAKNNTIKIKPVKNWKITQVYIFENNKDYSESMTYTHTYKNASSATVKGIHIWGNKTFNLTIDLYNTKTKGTLSVCYAVKAFEEK